MILYKGSFNNYVDQILPNFDHLPPSSGSRYSLHTTYFWFMGPNMEFLLTIYLPTSFWTLSYWMTTYDSILLWCRKTKLAKGNLFWLKKGSLRIDLTAELHFTMGPFLSENALEILFLWSKYWFMWTRKSIQDRVLTNQKTGFR